MSLLFCEKLYWESPATVRFQVVKTGLTALDALLFQFHGHYEKKLHFWRKKNSAFSVVFKKDLFISTAAKLVPFRCFLLGSSGSDHVTSDTARGSFLSFKRGVSLVRSWWSYFCLHVFRALRFCHSKKNKKKPGWIPRLFLPSKRSYWSSQTSIWLKTHSNQQ